MSNQRKTFARFTQRAAVGSLDEEKLQSHAITIFPYTYDDNDDSKLILQNGWLTKSVKSYFQSAALLDVLTIANLP